jgi:hypothetical protein
MSDPIKLLMLLIVLSYCVSLSTRMLLAGVRPDQAALPVVFGWMVAQWTQTI